MKKRYISYLSPLFVIFSLLLTVQSPHARAFGVVKQEDGSKVAPGAPKPKDGLPESEIYRKKMAERAAKRAARDRVSQQGPLKAGPQPAPGKATTSAGTRYDPRVGGLKTLSESNSASWLERTVAAALKRHPAKSPAEIRAIKVRQTAARLSATDAVPPVLYVNINKTDGPPYDGSSWRNAYQQLGEAFKYAHENPGVQQIWVANGVYRAIYDHDYIDEDGVIQEDYTFRLVPNVKIYGGFTGVEQSLAERKLATQTSYPFDDRDAGQDLVTILDGDEFIHHVVTSAGDVGSASLDGFLITGGNASLASDVSVEGMTISRNAGGGIVIINSSPSLANIEIYNSKAGKGAGIFVSNSAPSLTNFQISGNRAMDGAAIYASESEIVLTNSIINNNRADGSGAVFLLNSSDVLTNVTIARNRGEGSGGLLVDGGAPKIRNTIINDNRSNADIEIQVINGGVPSFAHSIVPGSGGSGSWHTDFGNDQGGNLDADAQMYNPGSGVFGLYPGSPAINKGNNLYFQSDQIPDLSALTTDYRGTARIIKGTVDIGALESIFGILETALTPNENGILFVKKGGTGTKSGHDWNNAAPEVADAVFASNLIAVKQIWVAGGTYHPLYRPDDFSKADPKSPYNAFLLQLDTQLYGGFKGDETSLEARDLSLTANASILSGDFNGNDNFNFTDLYNNGIKSEFGENARHLIYGFQLYSDNALDGFTIEGANNTSPVPGEKLFISETVVPTEYGSGLFILWTDTEVGFKNLVVRNNLGTKGGGFTAYGSELTIRNSAIYHNYTKGQGSGILDIASEGDLEIINTTVAQNLSVQGTNGAGVASVRGEWVEILNSIIANNLSSGAEPSSQANFYFDEATVYVANTIFPGSGGSVNWQLEDIGDDGGNLDVDPQFADMNVGDFSLTVCSRAIDAGDIDLYSSEEDIPVTDLAGKSRIFRHLIDMGAFEFQTERSPDATALAGNAKGSSFTFGNAGNAAHTFTAEAAVCDSDFLTLIPDNLNGLVTAKVWVDAQVNSYANAAYLQRHFDIVPADNPGSSTGRVVLYFTQTEFDALNSKLTPSEYLPTGQADGEDTRKANLRIYQFHGESSDGSGSPASYGNSRDVIDPDDWDIYWNAAQNRWEVSFLVEGFSGFFAGTVTQNPLPVRVISFEGKQTDNQQVKLDWKVAEQENIQVYEVEYSNNAKTFTRIGEVEANVLASTAYTYTDTLTHTGERAYYRLKILEMDGTTAYSKLISVKLPANEGWIAYPVPAQSELWIDWKQSDATWAEFTDFNGRILKKVRKISASQKIDISGMPAGVLLLKANGSSVLKVVKE
nr:choice-of-anchor Q domain-containing protein [uncultured Dyadobacter sp.]